MHRTAAFVLAPILLFYGGVVPVLSTDVYGEEISALQYSSTRDKDG